MSVPNTSLWLQGKTHRHPETMTDHAPSTGMLKNATARVRRFQATWAWTSSSMGRSTFPLLPEPVEPFCSTRKTTPPGHLGWRIHEEIFGHKVRPQSTSKHLAWSWKEMLKWDENPRVSPSPTFCSRVKPGSSGDDSCTPPCVDLEVAGFVIWHQVLAGLPCGIMVTRLKISLIYLYIDTFSIYGEKNIRLEVANSKPIWQPLRFKSRRLTRAASKSIGQEMLSRAKWSKADWGRMILAATKATWHHGAIRGAMAMSGVSKTHLALHFSHLARSNRLTQNSQSFKPLEGTRKEDLKIHHLALTHFANLWNATGKTFGSLETVLIRRFNLLTDLMLRLNLLTRNWFDATLQQECNGKHASSINSCTASTAQGQGYLEVT